MKLSVIIPVYNERKTVLEIIKRVQAVPVKKELIIVDDGSTDGTADILKHIRDNKHMISPATPEKDNLIKIVLKDKNKGKGAAIREGIKHISGEIVVIQDGDLEYDPMDWMNMLKAMEEKKADTVYGSRILGKGQKSSASFYYGGRLLSLLTNILYNSRITDEPTCYKMFKKHIIKTIRLNCTGFEFCPEITAKVLKKGCKIYEVPINYHPRKINEGKKIRWKDGIIAIWTLLKYRFTK